jgi:8-oxo-dGTP pyrophosphatase MutT (NUDIX family)
MFRYCPSCGSQNIRFEQNKVFRCPDCAFVYYHNTAAATGCVIGVGEQVLMLVRGVEPGRGKLDLPGGFVDPGEGVFEGLRRECREELGWDPGPACALFASFPNLYPYKGIVYNTCDFFFSVQAPNLRLEDLSLEKDEVAGAILVKPQELRPEDLAFDSARRAMDAYLEFIALKQ